MSFINFNLLSALYYLVLPNSFFFFVFNIMINFFYIPFAFVNENSFHVVYIPFFNNDPIITIFDYTCLILGILSFFIFKKK